MSAWPGQSVVAVKDGGVPITLGAQRASLTALHDTAPAADRVDWVAGTAGIWIRTASTPQRALTVLAREGADAAARTPARIAARILAACGITAPAGLDAVDTVVNGTAGWWGRDGLTARAGLDALLAPLGVWLVQGPAGDWSMGLTDSVPESAATWVSREDGSLTLPAGAGLLASLIPVPERGEGQIPASQLLLRHSRRPLVQDRAALLGDADSVSDPVGGPAVRAVLAQEWQGATYPAAGPDAGVLSRWPSAKVAERNTALRSGAAARAAQLWPQASRPPRIWQALVEVRPTTAAGLTPGAGVTLFHARYAPWGRRYRVLSSSWAIGAATATLVLEDLAEASDG